MTRPGSQPSIITCPGLGQALRQVYSTVQCSLYCTPGVQYTPPSLTRRVSPSLGPGYAGAGANVQSAELRPVQQASGNTRPGQSCRGQRGHFGGCCRRPLQHCRAWPASPSCRDWSRSSGCSYVAVLKLDQSQALASTPGLIFQNTSSNFYFEPHPLVSNCQFISYFKEYTRI